MAQIWGSADVDFHAKGYPGICWTKYNQLIPCAAEGVPQMLPLSCSNTKFQALLSLPEVLHQAGAVTAAALSTQHAGPIPLLLSIPYNQVSWVFLASWVVLLCLGLMTCSPRCAGALGQAPTLLPGRRCH